MSRGIMHAGPTLTEAERLDRLRLIRSENVGPITFRHLLRFYGTARAALEALPELARRAGRARPIRLCPAAEAEREAAALADFGGRLVCHGEAAYPRPLAAIEDAPPVLAVKGEAALLGRHAIAIVGARAASANGRHIAETLAAALGAAGFVVVSGMARGIDAAAHRGALATGTIAAQAGGLDVCFPDENRAIYDAISERGLLVSEQPFGTRPLARHFPRRNRIVSGLARGTVVIEAALRSGSLITARMALEQGREVFAVPGSPLDPRSRGANDLLRQGAVLTESADDVIRALGGALGPAAAEPAEPPAALPPPSESELDRARIRVIEALSPSPTAVDDLVRQCQLSAPVVAAVLLELELGGRIERHAGNRVARLGA
jgi:DNA processing protein